MSQLTDTASATAPSRTLIWYGLGILALLAAPFLFYPVFLVKLLCFALFACAFNLLLGSCGLLSFGHAAFFGTAGYVAGHAAKEWGFPFELAILCGTGAAGVLGFFFGYVSVRRSGLQFAMVTLALAQLVYFLAWQLPFTHAEDGLSAIPRGKVLGLFDLDNIFVLYYTTAVIFLIGFIAMHRMTHSTFGQLLRAIRDNEPRAISLGYEVNRYKLMAFVLSATLAGLAGSTKAIALKIAALTDVHWATSGSVILMTLLGGLGTLLGPVVGAGVVQTIEDYLSALPADFAVFGLFRLPPITAIVGAIFIICILLFRRGIVGEIQHWLGRR
ncbi:MULTISPECIES: branched-chain amino acid ABC transporter permease [unclassified Beijerinckia]|uniref:branched-chain amino acid ABC transporter permease n=1 Tax=unclassified Beijerinckia TaxID=2638183 RepID=UPI000899CBBA|nr:MULTISPECIES: branched-chain amino acid ABC transporter permease [unclassified Beijerinckia]MDH7797294.1 branched-chain amino acid transport system permease protein [Beijerinckia sp. GAS462]SEC79775.1 amino acid/amide ABC transporter membrane protein 2, HAAT family [Beijerinckia sp. 28-YEA-48]